MSEAQDEWIEEVRAACERAARATSPRGTERRRAAGVYYDWYVGPGRHGLAKQHVKVYCIGGDGAAYEVYAWVTLSDRGSAYGSYVFPLKDPRDAARPTAPCTTARSSVSSTNR